MPTVAQIKQKIQEMKRRASELRRKWIYSTDKKSNGWMFDESNRLLENARRLESTLKDIRNVERSKATSIKSPYSSVRKTRNKIEASVDTIPHRTYAAREQKTQKLSGQRTEMNDTTMPYVPFQSSESLSGPGLTSTKQPNIPMMESKPDRRGKFYVDPINKMTGIRRYAEAWKRYATSPADFSGIQYARTTKQLLSSIKEESLKAVSGITYGMGEAGAGALLFPIQLAKDPVRTTVDIIKTPLYMAKDITEGKVWKVGGNIAGMYAFGEVSKSATVKGLETLSKTPAGEKLLSNAGIVKKEYTIVKDFGQISIEAKSGEAVTFPLIEVEKTSMKPKIPVSGEGYLYAEKRVQYGNNIKAESPIKTAIIKNTVEPFGSRPLVNKPTLFLTEPRPFAEIDAIRGSVASDTQLRSLLEREYPTSAENQIVARGFLRIGVEEGRKPKPIVSKRVVLRGGKSAPTTKETPKLDAVRHEKTGSGAGGMKMEEVLDKQKMEIRPRVDLVSVSEEVSIPNAKLPGFPQYTISGKYKDTVTVSIETEKPAKSRTSSNVAHHLRYAGTSWVEKIKITKVLGRDKKEKVGLTRGKGVIRSSIYSILQKPIQRLIKTTTNATSKTMGVSAKYKTSSTTKQPFLSIFASSKIGKVVFPLLFQKTRVGTTQKHRNISRKIKKRQPLLPLPLADWISIEKKDKPGKRAGNRWIKPIKYLIEKRAGKRHAAVSVPGKKKRWWLI